MCLHGITFFTNCSLLEINVCKYFLGTLLVVCKQQFIKNIINIIKNFGLSL